MITCDKYIGYCVCAFFLDHLFVFTTKQRRTTSTTIDRPSVFVFCFVSATKWNICTYKFNSSRRRKKSKQILKRYPLSENNTFEWIEWGRFHGVDVKAALILIAMNYAMMATANTNFKHFGGFFLLMSW